MESERGPAIAPRGEDVLCPRCPLLGETRPTAIVCGPCERLSVWGAVWTAPPSTVNCNPVGLVWIVVPVSGGKKFATKIAGPFMVTLLVELLDGLLR